MVVPAVFVFPGREIAACRSDDQQAPKQATNTRCQVLFFCRTSEGTWYVVFVLIVSCVQIM